LDKGSPMTSLDDETDVKPIYLFYKVTGLKINTETLDIISSLDLINRYHVYNMDSWIFVVTFELT